LASDFDEAVGWGFGAHDRGCGVRDLQVFGGYVVIGGAHGKRLLIDIDGSVLAYRNAWKLVVARSASGEYSPATNQGVRVDE
jgi:hypothetical protein